MEGDSARGIIMFDRFGTDKLVCRADPIERVSMVRNTISSIGLFHSCHSFSVRYESGKAERVFDSLSLCLIL